MAKNGRPEKFKKAWADDNAHRIPELMANGESIAEVCVALEMSKDSFYKCKRISKKFDKAYREGLTRSEAYWCRLGREGATGEASINSTAWIFNMKNRFQWRDKPNDTIAANFNDCSRDMEILERIKLLCLNGEITLQDGLTAINLLKKAPAPSSLDRMVDQLDL